METRTNNGDNQNYGSDQIASLSAQSFYEEKCVRHFNNTSADFGNLNVSDCCCIYTHV